MNVRVEENRFLSVACEPDERIVFDRKETRYHLLRDSAARLWDEICEGGTFEVATPSGDGQDPVTLLAEAGLVGIEDDTLPSAGITRRVWLSRTGKVSAAAVVLPLVASISTPQLVLGQTNGPSLEEVDLDQINTNSFSEPVETSSTQSRSGRTRRSERSGSDTPSGSGGGLSNEQTGSSEGDNGTRTRTRRRTGQTSTTSTTETTRTRRRDG